MSKRILLAIGMLAIATALIGTFESDAAARERRQMDTRGWAETEGTIASNSFEIGRSANDGVTFMPRFAYTYAVDGEVRGATRLDYVATTVTRTRADELKQEFPVGGVVPVYYDPQAPEYSVLIRGWTEAHAGRRAFRRTLEAVAGVGVLVVAIGVVLGRATITSG